MIPSIMASHLGSAEVKQPQITEPPPCLTFLVYVYTIVLVAQIGRGYRIQILTDNHLYSASIHSDENSAG